MARPPAATTAASKAADQRRRLLAAVHMKARDRQLIDGTDKVAWRDWLTQHFGVCSSADLTPGQLVRALALLDGKHVDRPLLGGIYARLEKLGKPIEYGCGIARNMFKRERLEWCTDAQLHKIVAALEYQLAREARRA